MMTINFRPFYIQNQSTMQKSELKKIGSYAQSPLFLAFICNSGCSLKDQNTIPEKPTIYSAYMLANTSVILLQPPDKNTQALQFAY